MSDSENITLTGNADLVEEVDDEYSKKEGIDFRKIKQHLEEAIPIRPRMQPEDTPRPLKMNSWDEAPALSEKVDENPALHFGTRLTEFLERMVYEKSGAVGKPRLYGKLQRAMEEFGLRDIALQEGARSRQKSVEESLNISAFSDRDINKQADMARKIFCAYIREQDPEIQAEDDQIVRPKKFLDALKHVAERKAAQSNELFVANRDPESLYAGQPLVEALIKDMAVNQAEGRELDVTLDDLVDHDDFVASLALPTVGEKNLSSVWEANIRQLWSDDTKVNVVDDAAPPAAADATDNAGASVDHDDPLYIAENRSSHGIGTTTLQVAHKDDEGHIRPVSVHIVRNTQRNKTLIVSEKAPSKLLAAFREAGIIYVDRNDPAATAKVESGLGEVTRGLPAPVKGWLLHAFKYRNDVPEETPEGKPESLPDLLTNGDIEMIYPKFVVKQNNLAS